MDQDERDYLNSDINLEQTYNSSFEDNQKLRFTEDKIELREQRRRDKALSRPVLLYLLLTVICVFGRDSILAPLGISENIYYYIRYGLPTVATLYALFFIKKKLINWFVGLELFFGLSYIFAFLQDNMLQGNVLVYVINTLIICIPGAICIASIEDYEFLYNRFKLTSIVVSLFALLYIYQPLVGTTYSMPASYQILWCSTIHVNEIFKKKSKKPVIVFFLALSIFEVISIFFRGARGPLLCFAVYLAVKVIIEMFYNRKALFIGLTGVLSLVVVSLNLDKVLSWISLKLNQAGLYSRSLNYIMTKSIFDDSGRSVWRQKAVDLIWERPLWGYGASSDVKLLGGQYAHSLPLELMLDFGVLVGGTIFVIICIYVLGVFFSNEGVKRDLKLIFLTEGFVMLFFSGTYLQSVFLFLFIGVLLSEEHKFKIRFGNH